MIDVEILLNFCEAEENDNSKSWIAKFDAEKRHQRLYLSHDIQNEINSDISREISLQLKYEVLQSKYFCLICDGTQDVSGMEQECMSIRFVHQNFVPQEVFVGLYQINEPTGQNIAAIFFDRAAPSFYALYVSLYKLGCPFHQRFAWHS